jgi:hypothetical protein
MTRSALRSSWSPENAGTSQRVAYRAVTFPSGQRLRPGQPGVMGSAVAHRNGSLQSGRNEKVAGILEDQRDGDGGA